MTDGFDLVVRGGTVADGLGNPLRLADVAVKDGRIAAVGTVPGKGRREIDARGKLVTPGFVDVHTHYDGQAIWDSCFAPSSCHGVTTAVMGNCGVGFAPVRPQDHDRLIELMEGVEDIPGIALHEGLDWSWESFGEYLDALERRPHDIDYAAYLPHAALRVYVMGERASRLEMATPQDIGKMRTLAEEAMRAGAMGFSTSRSINHKSVNGASTPSLKASEEELTAIAQGLQDAGQGVLQMITDFDGEDVDGEFALMRRLVQASGRPLSFSLMQKHGNKDGWKRVLELTEQAVADGLAMTAQVAPRGVGVLLGLQGTRNMFMACPSYQPIAAETFERRLALMGEPALRDALVRELTEQATVAHDEPDWTQPGMPPMPRRLVDFNNIYPLGNPPRYDPGPGDSIAAIAVREGRSPAEVAYSLTLENGGREMLYAPAANYAEGTLAACEAMLGHPNSVLGLGDGGAHVGIISDASFPTFILTYWQRKFGIPWLIQTLTSDTARSVGLNDRGVLAPGMKADINVIDMERLGILVPRMQLDLPAGGRRLVQRAEGYVATVVSGVTTYLDGRPTGELPGRLVRGPTPAPATP